MLLNTVRKEAPEKNTKRTIQSSKKSDNINKTIHARLDLSKIPKELRDYILKQGEIQ